MKTRSQENLVIGLIVATVVISGALFIGVMFQTDGAEEVAEQTPVPASSEPDLFARPIQPEAVKVLPNQEAEREKRLAPVLESQTIDVIKVKRGVSLEYYVGRYIFMGGDLQLTLKCNGWRVEPDLPDGYEIKICGKPRH